MNSCRIQLKCRFLAGFEKGTSEGILPLQRTQKNIQGLHLISVPSVPCYNCLKIHVIQKRWTPQIAMCWIFFWVTYGDVNWLLKWGTVYIPPHIPMVGRAHRWWRLSGAVVYGPADSISFGMGWPRAASQVLSWLGGWVEWLVKKRLSEKKYRKISQDIHWFGHWVPGFWEFLICIGTAFWLGKNPLGLWFMCMFFVVLGCWIPHLLNNWYDVIN